MKNLVINVALAPYRIDFYNALSQDGESAFYFTQDYVEGSQFDFTLIRDGRTFRKGHDAAADLGKQLAHYYHLDRYRTVLDVRGLAR